MSQNNKNASSNKFELISGAYGVVSNPALEPSPLNKQVKKVTKFYFTKKNHEKGIKNVERVRKILNEAGKNNAFVMEPYRPILAKNLPLPIYQKMIQAGQNVKRFTSPANLSPDQPIYATAMVHLGQSIFEVIHSSKERTAMRSCPFHHLMGQWYKLHHQLALLAKKKYVHGDIRLPNIMFNKETCNMHFIDFDMFDDYPTFMKEYYTIFGTYSNPPEAVFFYYIGTRSKPSTYQPSINTIGRYIKKEKEEFMSLFRSSPYLGHLSTVIEQMDKDIKALKATANPSSNEIQKKIEKRAKAKEIQHKIDMSWRAPYPFPNITFSEEASEDRILVTCTFVKQDGYAVDEEELEYIIRKFIQCFTRHATIACIQRRKTRDDPMVLLEKEVLQREWTPRLGTMELILSMEFVPRIQLDEYKMATTMNNDFESFLIQDLLYNVAKNPAAAEEQKVDIAESVPEAEVHDAKKLRKITALYKMIHEANQQNMAYLESKRTDKNANENDDDPAIEDALRMMIADTSFPSFDSYAYAWVMSTLFANLYPGIMAPSSRYDAKQVKNNLVSRLLQTNVPYTDEYLELIVHTLRQMAEMFGAMRAFTLQDRMNAEDSFMVMEQIYHDFMKEHQRLIPTNVASLKRGGRRPVKRRTRRSLRRLRIRSTHRIHKK